MRLSTSDALRLGVVTPTALAQPPSPKKEKSVGAAPVGKKLTVKDMEGLEQSNVIKEFRLRYPGLGHLLIHIPNGGSRKNAFEGWRLKEQGVRAGVSDLFLPVARGGYFGLWVEFKATPPYNSPPSPGQLEWLQLMKEQGYSAHLCVGTAAAMESLIAYMALPETR